MSANGYWAQLIGDGNIDITYGFGRVFGIDGYVVLAGPGIREGLIARGWTCVDLPNGVGPNVDGRDSLVPVTGRARISLGGRQSKRRSGSVHLSADGRWSRSHRA